MTSLKGIIRRESAATIRDAGKDRPIIISIEPPDLICLKLKGSRGKPYEYSARELFWQAALRAESAPTKIRRGKP